MAGFLWMRLAILVFVATAALHPQRSLAADEDPLQDFCVKDTTQKLHVNGFPCKDPAQVQASDFASDSLKKPGKTSNALGVAVTPANVLTFGGLNTQGILFLAKGTLLVGFVTSTPKNKLFAQTIKAGELFIFPRGLNPGTSQVARALSASTPLIDDVVLEKALKLNAADVQRLRSLISKT
ncbi:hypothetical protein O6H91_20G052100 [Diphasiastrum complanatum]|uniref:Uncharacterized protein n=1 Tax=Diphasiastrum complanatum TaxID=34168 RepID=A0ACC2AQE9_DIPCM|nr:hypothetical protein O6H91_20G052100 [Diphasiastrum complanatum]